MNQKQRNHEIDLMWRQLESHELVKEHDYKRGCTVRLMDTTHAFNTTREVHAYLTGAYELIGLLVYSYNINIKRKSET